MAIETPSLDLPHHRSAGLADRAALARLLRAGLLTGVVDGLFSSILSVAVYHSTPTRLFQGVAATLLGPAAMDGGRGTAAIGLSMHFGVALGWSAVFLILYERSAGIRRAVQSRFGVSKVAAVYGPCIWLVMSLVVIPLLLHRAPVITARWWVQLIGHVPFVAVPIVAVIGRGATRSVSLFSDGAGE
jgi:hypothetical protein